MFTSFLIHYKYVILFLGMFWGGETAILAGVYFAEIGVMNFHAVIVAALTASIAADIVWYWVGTVLSYDTLKKLPFIRGRRHHIDKLERFLEQHALRALFYSKFVYGTRMIVQILCGTHRVNLMKYFGINILGHILIILGMVALGQAVHANLQALRHVAYGIELAFLAILLVVSLLNILIKRLAGKAFR